MKETLDLVCSLTVHPSVQKRDGLALLSSP